MNDKSLIKFGSREEITELARRILDFLPGARDVPPEGRMALAQLAITHGLDPFTGEAWAIPQRDRDTNQIIGFQLMVGIAGWRAHAFRTGEYCGRVFQNCTPEERKALGVTHDDLAIKCIVTRRRTGEHAMHFDGYGTFRFGKDKSKMNPFQCARTRAERDAMKAAFPLNIGASIGPGLDVAAQIVDDSGEVIESQAIETEPQPPQPPPPPPQSQPQPKQAVVKTPNWPAIAAQIAEAVPYYMHQGKPALIHILRAAAAEGFGEVTDANAEPIIEALAARVRRKAAGRGAEGK